MTPRTVTAHHEGLAVCKVYGVVWRYVFAAQGYKVLSELYIMSGVQSTVLEHKNLH